MQRLTLSLLICVLLLQLVSTRASLPVTEYSFGDITQALRSVTTAQPLPTPTMVRYVAQTEPYDSVLFVGDVLLARNIEYLMNQAGNDYPYRGLSFQKLAKNPAVVANFEASIPKVHRPTPALQMTFSVSEIYIPALARAGFTHLSQANNHAADYGQAGRQNAATVLQKNQLTAFGRPDQLDKSAVEFITIADKVVAVIAAYTLQTLPSYTQLQEIFTYASARSDLQVVYVHWGDEYVSVHNSRQREAAERFVEAGADLVVGHHPHVVQDVELIDGVPVFYSLGNYIFDQYDEVNTQEGLMLHLQLSQDQPQISIVPVTSVGTLSQPHFMSPSQHAVFLEKLAARSDPELRATIKKGYILLPGQVASSSKIAMISQ